MRETAPVLDRSCEAIVESVRSVQQTVSESYDEVVHAIEAYHGQQHLYEAVFTDSQDAIFVLHADSGLMLRTNTAASTLLGYTRDELCGRDIMDFVDPQDRDSCGSALATARRDGHVRPQMARMNHKNGEYVLVSAAAFTIEFDGGLHFVVSIRDESARADAEAKLRAVNGKLSAEIAETRQAMQEQRDHYAELESQVTSHDDQIKRTNSELEKAIARSNRLVQETRQAGHAKRAFIAHMTHELRTPLNSVIGMTELLLDMELGEKQRETAGIILNSARSLMTVVSEVLDYSKMEEGKLELASVPFEVRDIVANLADTFALKLKAKKLAIKFDVAEKVPLALEGDPGRLRQILTNLVSNAVKYTEEGGITVRVVITDTGPQEIGLRFDVEDTGPGIDPERQKTLFDAYAQADASEGKRYDATELGLAISRQLAETMGGSMGVDSKPGEGSRFWFTARFGRATDERLDMWRERQRRPAPAAEVPTKDTRILIVEDNQVNQKVALGMLGKLGYTARCVDSGLDAMRLMSEEDFDLVFMDVEMPGMGGLEVTRRVRAGEANERNRDVAIIAMTAHATREDRRACLESGMNDYVAKPINCQRIDEAMARVREEREAVVNPSDGLEAFSIDALVERMGGDVSLATDILETFLNDTTSRLTSIKGAVLNYDWDFAQQGARTIEGGARNVHANIVAHVARELLQAATARQQENAASTIKEMQLEVEKIRKGL